MTPELALAFENSDALDESQNTVIVAVIDTGIDSKHQDLQDHLWINKGESGIDSKGRDKTHNQIDDDRNGYIDDVYGWNFVNSNPDPSDQHGHGTHISGIIAKLAPRARLMSLKYFDPKSNDASGISNTVRAIEYATKMGAKIINYSAGGPSANAKEKRAIEHARELGILVVAAAGNEAENSDYHHYYPADYGISNILSVTAISADKNILPSSNFGIETVHVAAPGKAILSTLPGGKYGTMSGTSQATAFASGIAAKFMEQGSDWPDPEYVAQHLIHTGIMTNTLNGKTRARTYLDAQRALQIRDDDADAAGNKAINSFGIDQRIFSSDFLDANTRLGSHLLGKE